MVNKAQFDDFIIQLSGKAIAFLNTLMTITAVMTLADWLDLGSKIVTFVITLVVGTLSARYYILQNRIKEKELEIKDQELYRAIRENKRRERDDTV